MRAVLRRGMEMTPEAIVLVGLISVVLFATMLDVAVGA
jgi:hypothetical protein